MALFSDLLSLDEKSELAATILTFESKKPYHWNLRRPGEEDNSYQIGKPILKLDLDENTSLKDLVGSNSFLIFDLLNLSWDWLRMNPDKWEDSQDYGIMRNYVRTVKVTNDVAERGVKLMADYATILTEDDDMRQSILHAVERNRIMYPNFKKNVLNG